MLKIEFEFQTPEEAAAAVQAIIAAQQGCTQPPAQLSPAAAVPSASPVTPTQTQAPTAPPVQAQPPVTPPTVPTAAAPTYGRDQIMTAGAALIDAGKMNELMGLLNAFGVQAVTQLKQEQLGAFATELRKLGAQI